MYMYIHVGTSLIPSRFCSEKACTYFLYQQCVCNSPVQYDSPVGPSEEFYYDHGVELRPEDGLYGKHDYIKHATRGTLSIHSLYLILWSSFAGFSLALLTQPSAEKELTGKVFSGSEPVRQYCATQLQRLWQLLRSGLGVCNEERLMLVQGCLNTLFEVGPTLAMLAWNRGLYVQSCSSCVSARNCF